MPNRPITPKEKKAWTFAKEAHKDQIRKFINQPYFDTHVQKVNGIVKRYTRDEDILCAALYMMFVRIAMRIQKLVIL